MAFDPIQEDCHRLVLEALRRDNIPLTDGAAVERLMEQFTRNPAPLIVHDRDRAGHLIAKVVEAVDYRIPFIPDDTQAEQEEAAAENMLREAAALDPTNWDAQRMLTALTANSNEEYVQYLVSKCDEVEHDLALKIASAQDPYEREAAGDLTRRPYLRWLAALASRALISGRYRMSLEAANRSLDFAPNAPAGVRHTAMLAMAKLEYPAEELKRFRSAHSVPYLANTPLRRRPKDAERDLDPWTLIALMSAAWRELDYEGAERYLRILARSCPHAAEALYFQTEFPDGVYARVNVWAPPTSLSLRYPRQRRYCRRAWAPPTTPALPPGSPPTISCVPRSTSASCGRPSRACRLREETSNGSERLHPRLPGARLRCVAPRTHRCSTRACP